MASGKCNICGWDNPTEARFCASCGATLAAGVEPAVPATYVTAPSVTATEYIGFWIRFGASIIDGIVIWLVSVALSIFLLRSVAGYRLAFLSSVVWFPLPLLYYWLFTGLKGQTLGKMLVGIKVVNAQGNIPGLGGAALREVLGKLISAIVLFIGFFWIAFDNNKQGWHDKIASTYVVKLEPSR